MSQYDRKDRFYQKAKQEGYVARSAYKLIEMDRRFGILKPGAKIIDLGCAPGGWLQVAEKKGARIVGIDLLPLKYKPGVACTFIQGDFLDPDSQRKVREALEGKADWVLSDLSPNLSGIKFADIGGSLELSRAVLDFAKQTLKPGGGLVLKIFPGEEMGEFRKELSLFFQKTTTFIPEATRKSSNEIYLVNT
ncbi:MAG: RlmE family RNA methyltransferase [Deltaproteobacteria bacterium]|nr:RlmE family RNA methyltransferase [Deltaproteobacteria bacterium]